MSKSPVPPYGTVLRHPSRPDTRWMVVGLASPPHDVYAVLLTCESPVLDMRIGRVQPIGWDQRGDCNDWIIEVPG